MDVKGPIMKSKKKPSKNRKPIKKKPPKRMRSFTEIQLKFYADEDIYNPMQDQPKPTLTDKYIIDMMKEADRFPIPESLVGRRKNQKRPYVLKIDSLISAAFKIEEVNEWANSKDVLDAPYNTMHSEDDFPLEDSQDSDEQNVFPAIPKDKLLADPSLKDKQFDIRLLDTSPYRLESLLYFPYRNREGEIPLKLLKIPKLSFLLECSEKI